MPRRRRSDSPGTLHHVFDRGIARRTVFETARDVRYFLSLLACEVRAGRIEIIGFAILTTHFHLFVRSPCGDLSAVMQRVLNLYVRYFNRTRRRDGPLFRGRFGSKVVRSERYARLLLRYIDQNAPGARLVFEGVDYPYGSARHYVSDRRPPWLSTDWVDERMEWPAPSERAQRYRDVFGRSISPGARWLVEARALSPVADDDFLDDLIGAAPAEVLHWMRRKTALADGTQPAIPCADPITTRAVVERYEALDPDWKLSIRGGNRVRVWPIVRVGLLRTLTGATFAEMARLLDTERCGVQRRMDQHVWLTMNDDAYVARVADLASAAMHAMEGDDGRS